MNIRILEGSGPSGPAVSIENIPEGAWARSVSRPNEFVRKGISHPRYLWFDTNAGEYAHFYEFHQQNDKAKMLGGYWEILPKGTEATIS